MPEGHTVHRIALQFAADVVGHRVEVTSPQGRFAAGAALLDGLRVTDARAHGKHLFLGFRDGDAGEGTTAPTTAADDVEGAAPGPDGRTGPDGRSGPDHPWVDAADHWLHVHLGLYGAWDLHGRVSRITDESEALGSLGAPRLRRAVRMGEGERSLPSDGDDETSGRTSDAADDVTSTRGASTPADGTSTSTDWQPPDPVGQVRVRIATDHGLADLRGPITCEVLTPDEVRTVVTAAGPDPRTAGPGAEDEVVRRLTRRRVPVGQLLMDQSVVSGIGNIYRAEMLFRARLHPWTPGNAVPDEVARTLWRDWVDLLDDGVRTGVMVTRADLDGEGRRRALADPAERHAVYGRGGEPCLVCGTPVAVDDLAGRRVYWCPVCQSR